MVTGVGTTMPTGGVTVGATPPAQHVPQEAGQPPAQTTPAVTATRRSSENRRSNKPIMEKRRRARINNSLNDLQKLMLDAKIKDSSSRHSKLEKADVLEMAVKYIKNLQRQSIALSRSADPNDPNKFRAGFNECISEVGSFTGLDAAAKRCLQAYLTSRIGTTDANGNNGQVTAQQPVQPAPPTTQLQVHILPQVDATPRIQVQQSNGIFFTNANGTGLQLLPTRLANGDIALVLPAGAKATPVTSPSLSPTPTSPLPTLIPIPQRTASTASSSSSASSTSSTSTSAASPVTFETSPASFRDQSTGYSSGNSHRDVATSPANGYTSDPEFDPRICSPPLQKPLALVMRKSVVQSTDSKPWRPW